MTGTCYHTHERANIDAGRRRAPRRCSPGSQFLGGAVKGRPGEELMADLGEVVSRQAGRFQH